MAKYVDNPREFNVPMEVEVRRTVRTPTGSERESWAKAEGGDVWVALRPMFGREALIASSLELTANMVIELPYWEGLGPNHRFNYGGRIFNMAGPPQDVDNAHIRMVCMVAELVATE